MAPGEAIRMEGNMIIPARTVRLMRIGVVSDWAVFSIHHAYEAGLSHDPMPISMVIGATVMLVPTLAFLGRYERTGGQLGFVLFSTVTLIAWVGFAGLWEGFYGHTLKDILYFFFHVPPAALPRSALGLKYDVPTDVFGEATGVLPFLLSTWVAVAWLQLAVHRRAA
jgi:hypothetical protein